MLVALQDRDQLVLIVGQTIAGPSHAAGDQAGVADFEGDLAGDIVGRVNAQLAGGGKGGGKVMLVGAQAEELPRQQHALGRSQRVHHGRNLVAQLGPHLHGLEVGGGEEPGIDARGPATALAEPTQADFGANQIVLHHVRPVTVFQRIDEELIDAEVSGMDDVGIGHLETAHAVDHIDVSAVVQPRSAIEPRQVHAVDRRDLLLRHLVELHLHLADVDNEGSDQH